MKKVKLKPQETDSLVVELLQEEKGFRYPCFVKTNHNSQTGYLDYFVVEDLHNKTITRLRFYDYRSFLTEILERKGFIVKSIRARFGGKRHDELYYELDAREATFSKKKRR